MKKFFVSLMALILGTTGYAVVDKTIETRVETLESQVSELQEEVSVLEDELDDSLDVRTNKLEVGDTIKCFYEDYAAIEGRNNPKYHLSEKEYNEIYVNNVEVTVVEVYETDTYEHCIKPYKVRVDCDCNTIVPAPYVVTDSLQILTSNTLVEGTFELVFELNNERYALEVQSNYNGVSSAEFDIPYVEAINFMCDGFYTLD